MDDVFPHIAAGEILALLVPAGKALPLRTLNALTRPSRGRVNVNGVGNLGAGRKSVTPAAAYWYDFPAF